MFYQSNHLFHLRVKHSQHLCLYIIKIETVFLIMQMQLFVALHVWSNSFGPFRYRKMCGRCKQTSPRLAPRTQLSISRKKCNRMLTWTVKTALAVFAAFTNRTWPTMIQTTIVELDSEATRIFADHPCELRISLQQTAAVGK